MLRGSGSVATVFGVVDDLIVLDLKIGEFHGIAFTSPYLLWNCCRWV